MREVFKPVLVIAGKDLTINQIKKTYIKIISVYYYYDLFISLSRIYYYYNKVVNNLLTINKYTIDSIRYLRAPMIKKHKHTHKRKENHILTEI